MTQNSAAELWVGRGRIFRVFFLFLLRWSSSWINLQKVKKTRFSEGRKRAAKTAFCRFALRWRWSNQKLTEKTYLFCPFLTFFDVKKLQKTAFFSVLLSLISARSGWRGFGLLFHSKPNLSIYHPKWRSTDLILGWQLRSTFCAEKALFFGQKIVFFHLFLTFFVQKQLFLDGWCPKGVLQSDYCGLVNGSETHFRPHSL